MHQKMNICIVCMLLDIRYKCNKKIILFLHVYTYTYKKEKCVCLYVATSE